MSGSESYHFPYEIRHSSELGRYVVAARNLEPLETVICERPLVCAPTDDSSSHKAKAQCSMCLGCCAKLSGKGSLCSTCKWPVCNEQCETIAHHNSNECGPFSKHHIFPADLPYPHLLNETIFVLRCLLLKVRDPTLWKETVLKFEHHNDLRKGKPECAQRDKKLIKNLSVINTSSWFELKEEEVIMICGVINVNAFSSTKMEDEIKTGFRKVKRRVTVSQCLFPTATLIAHQCVPNASWTVSGSPHFEQTIRTTVPIKKGDMISIAYAPQEIMWPTLQRLISSSDVAHFICQCPRCLDPSEFGTFIGAFKCERCEQNCDPNGYLLPLKPVDAESSWICGKCKEEKNVSEVVNVVHRIEQEFNEIKAQLYDRQEEVEEIEQLYKESVDSHLHPNHFLLLEMSLRILNRNAFSVYHLDIYDLDRYIFHCQSLLSMYDVLSPGLCRARALVMYYATVSKMVRERKRKGCSASQSREALEAINRMQEEALAYFKSEGSGFNQYVVCLEEEIKCCLREIGYLAISKVSGGNDD